MSVKASAKVLAVFALTVLFAACAPPDDQRKNEQQGRAGAPTGCCQRTETSCASPVTKEQCDEIRGAFHEGGDCRSDTGSCGVEHE
ncbi:hypothetical protein [Microbulbifer rhizosphaerae]|uniref:Lipoprotein n=1 Tax=Microbulbifer rhizosphaerae TaxID=1562603 RepID=A0A7W4WCK6_9GAMM|nr:hypothetical protein [Microbulbifer rhizosphaerae]MBB3061101.1 hypothetical protein [Microbulbifer rhizosphaerae]